MLFIENWKVKFKTPFGKTLGAIMLFIALLSPSAVELYHSFECHKHLACDEDIAHLHEAPSQCDLCSEYSITYNFDLVDILSIAIPKNLYQDEENTHFFHYSSIKTTHAQLRAPPVLS